MESEHDAYGDRDSDTRPPTSADDPADPQLRDGLFRAPAELKGVTVGTVKDSAGRTGRELAPHGASAPPR
ncbi:hypothetical protein [Streptomyces mirabilis]|uniref:hypothetical protein n=1 Tax=Streptomyces mirabilis TaxID=68239 RepID=UPI00333107A0